MNKKKYPIHYGIECKTKDGLTNEHVGFKSLQEARKALVILAKQGGELNGINMTVGWIEKANAFTEFNDGSRIKDTMQLRIIDGKLMWINNLEEINARKWVVRCNMNGQNYYICPSERNPGQIIAIKEEKVLRRKMDNYIETKEEKINKGFKDEKEATRIAIGMQIKGKAQNITTGRLNTRSGEFTKRKTMKELYQEYQKVKQTQKKEQKQEQREQRERVYSNISKI